MDNALNEDVVRAQHLIDSRTILKYLPHRYPMLLVDRVVEIHPGKSCKGLKNVTINEPFFQGHYPGTPVMPGVLILESVAQVGGLILLADPRHDQYLPLIGAIEKAKFKRQVTPGDQLMIETELLWYRNTVGRLLGQAMVDGQVAASMEMTFKLIPRES
jgi:beta-hydroxyacyl-ACP dehydratase FabZ